MTHRADKNVGAPPKIATAARASRLPIAHPSLSRTRAATPAPLCPFSSLTWGQDGTEPVGPVPDHRPRCGSPPGRTPWCSSNSRPEAYGNCPQLANQNTTQTRCRSCRKAPAHSPPSCQRLLCRPKNCCPNTKPPCPDSDHGCHYSRSHDYLFRRGPQTPIRHPSAVGSRQSVAFVFTTTAALFVPPVPFVYIAPPTV